MPTLVLIFLSLLWVNPSMVVSAELRAGSWNVSGFGVIPVYKDHDGKYHAYLYKRGVYTLRKNSDGTFEQVSFDDSYFNKKQE